jgi:hypothetical protein
MIAHLMFDSAIGTTAAAECLNGLLNNQNRLPRLIALLFTSTARCVPKATLNLFENRTTIWIRLCGGMIARGNSAALKGEVNEKVGIVRFGRTSWRGLDFGSGQGPQAEQAGPSSFRHAEDRF